jgi:hypothetical protein
LSTTGVVSWTWTLRVTVADRAPLARDSEVVYVKVCVPIFSLS